MPDQITRMATRGDDMPPWIIALGVGAALAAYLKNKFGSTPPSFIDPATGKPRIFTPQNPDMLTRFVNLISPLELHPSQGLIDYIKNLEKLAYTVYHGAADAANVYTIGYGHKIVQGDPYWPYGSVKSITSGEANALLANDVERTASGVRQLVKVPLTQGQFDALVDFAFNVGVGNFSRSTLLKYVNAMNYEAAANEFSKWVYADNKIAGGLVQRRLAEAANFKVGLT